MSVFLAVSQVESSLHFLRDGFHGLRKLRVDLTGLRYTVISHPLIEVGVFV